MAKYQDKVIKYFEQKGYLVLKLIRANKNGFADLIAIKDGKTTFIEVKEKNDRISKLQIYRGNETKKYGCDFIITQDGTKDDITRR